MLCVLRACSYVCLGDGTAPQSSCMKLQARPATTSNMEYVSPKSVLLQPKLLNSNLDGKQNQLVFVVMWPNTHNTHTTNILYLIFSSFI